MKSTKTKPSKAPDKWKTRHRITYELETDIVTVALASMGRSTKQIQRATGLSASQITYRLAKAKRGEGMSEGYRTAWRNGTSETARLIEETFLGSVKDHVADVLPPLFKRPPAQVSPQSV